MDNLAFTLPKPPNASEIEITYSLYAPGSASFGIKCGDTNFCISDFGSMTDGLGDLVRAALIVATGERYADVLFDCEPQLWGLAMEPAGLRSDNVRIARLTIKDGGKQNASAQRVWDWSAPIVFDAHMTTDSFAHAVLKVARQVRGEFDDERYRERWGFYGSLEGFPLRGLTALETALGIAEYRE